MTGGAAVGVQGEEQRGKDAALRRLPVLMDRESELNALLPVRQEVSDPSAGGVRHIQLGELLLSVTLVHLL